MFEITRDNYRLFAYTNADQLHAVQGVVVNFHGLNNGLNMVDSSENLCSFCTEHQLLYVFPYLHPWNWMNPDAVRMTDHILDALWEAFSLPQNFPLALAGRSMGGHGALIYAIQGKYRPTCCALNCPVCDLIYHYGEREDVGRTLYAAFCGVAPTLEEALKKTNPISMIPQLPRIPYYFAHCEQDSKVSKQHHSDRMVPLLRQAGLQVEYRIVPERDHTELTDEAYDELFHFIQSTLSKSNH